jgi:hypothetical protein
MKIRFTYVNSDSVFFPVAFSILDGMPKKTCTQ